MVIEIWLPKIPFVHLQSKFKIKVMTNYKSPNIFSCIENLYEKLYMNPVPVPYSKEHLQELIKENPDNSTQLSINYSLKLAIQSLEKQLK